MAEFKREKIEELYPSATMYKPMKIQPSTDAQLKQADASGLWFAQLKKDGAWYMYEKVEEELGGYLFGRTESKKTGLLTEKSANVPHIYQALTKNLPPMTILIGEIYYPGKTSKDVVSIMGCLPAKAIQRQEGEYGFIHYYIHDILMYDGIDLVKNKVNNDTRYRILEKIFYLHKLDEFPYLELAKREDENLYEKVGSALAAGEEGMVFKLKDGLYEPDKRPKTNIKAKKVDFIDAVIIGFEEPTKEYYGKEIHNWNYWLERSERNANGEYSWTRAEGLLYEGYNQNPHIFIPVTKPYYMQWYNSRIVIGAWDGDNFVKIGTIHSGISDELKEDMTKNPNNYLGKVCKIQCMEKDSKERTLRHGFFKGLHEDKNPKECTIDSIF